MPEVVGVGELGQRTGRAGVFDDALDLLDAFLESALAEAGCGIAE